MQISELYKEYTCHWPESVIPLTPAGSNRRYYRMKGVADVVGVEGVSRQENDAFIYLSRHFFSRGLNVPEILSVSGDGMSYLERDLGDVSLFAVRDDVALLEKTMRLLARLHWIGSDGLDYSRCFPVGAFDFRSVMWDLNYFKYSFLNTSSVIYSEPELEEDFVRLAKRVDLITRERGRFMMRDFQSRNVMVKDGEPYLIDYQGGRKGPVSYDLASFLWQAKAGFSDDTRRHLIDVYIDEARKYGDIDAGKLRREVTEMALIRILQVLGAYGLRGKFERRPHFLQSIPPALHNLRTLLDAGIGDYPCLTDVLTRLVESECGNYGIEEEKYDGLTVRVNSFSYKKGIPDDFSGNGGGFVFDCRAMDNPGRYAGYRSLTGLDREVIDFLESRGEITQFLDLCYGLVDNAVANYLSRGFSSLMVSFGCTGGQHRSVYSAQHMAEHIKTRFPQARVILWHREQKTKTVL